MSSKGKGNKTATPTASKIYLNVKEVTFTVYTIEENNYFKLRDVMQALDVYVRYDNSTKTITLDTAKTYTGDLVSEQPTFAPVTTIEQATEEIQKIIKKYSANSQYILAGVVVAQNPPTTVGKLLTYNIYQIMYAVSDDIFDFLEPAVHETYHLVSIKGMNERQHLIGNNSAITFSFSLENIIKTEEATSKISESLKINRWSTYVSPGATSTANIYGAYGLLDEFSAYYYGGKSVVDCAEYLSQ